MIARYPYEPMRPKTRIPPLDRYAGPLPQGWHWQFKVDDERGIVRRHDDGSVEIFNRHWEPLAAHKASVFASTAFRLAEKFSGVPIFDVALLGFRGHWAPGAIILLDLPSGLPWADRYARIAAGDVPEWDPQNKVDPVPGEILRLPDFVSADDAQLREIFEWTRGLAGVEGLIGRDPAAPHQNGDSDRMVKIRWK